MGGLFGWVPYHISHSLIALAVAALVTLWVWKTPLFAAAYGLHLIMDVFVHESGTFNLFYIPGWGHSVDPIGYHGQNWWGSGMWMEWAAWSIALILWIMLTRQKKRG